tara:strand:- start:1215 stop:1439 length:225 start_codon:yes stop_codon:yes gene_type:complete
MSANKKEVQHILDSIAYATYNALEELGLSIEEANSIMEHVTLDRQVESNARLGMLDYERKLRLCGGPRQRIVNL